MHDDPRLTAYVLGELDPSERAEFDRELASSPELQDELDRIRSASARLEQALQREPCPAMTARNTLSVRPASSRYVAASIVAASLTLLIGLALSGGFLGPSGATKPEVAERSATELRNSEDSSASQAPSADVELEWWDPSESTEGRGDTESLTLPQQQSGTGVGFSIRSKNSGPRPPGSSAPQPNSPEGQTPSDRSVRIDPTPMFSQVGQVETNTFSNSNQGALGGGGSGALGGGGFGGGGFGYRVSPDGRDDRKPAINSGAFQKEIPGLRSRWDDDAVRAKVEATRREREPDGEFRFFMGNSDRRIAKDREASSKTAPSNEPDSTREKATEANRTTWQRARATPNASRLLVGDNDELPLQAVQYHVHVDGFRARVVMDLYFLNDRAQPLEGSFQLRLPNEASLYYFAFGESAFTAKSPAGEPLASRGAIPAVVLRGSGTGPKDILQARRETWSSVKEARMVPREKAAHAYSETVRRRIDPALVEWAGAGVFQTRVFPLAAGKLHRIVVGYDTLVDAAGEDLVYRLELPRPSPSCTVDVDVPALPGLSAEVTPTTRPFLANGRAFFHLTEKEIGKANEVAVRLVKPGRLLLLGEDETGSYFATRFTPPFLDGEETAGSPRAVFLLDTSLSSQPDKFNVWLKLLESILEMNRDALREFAVLSFNIESHWWRPKFTGNTPENVRELLAYCQTLSLEGATDLRPALAEAVAPTWSKADEKSARPDLFLLSDGAVTWGEDNVHLIGRTLQAGTGGTLFAYQTGLTGTAVGMLDHLARESGGAVFSLANEEEIGRVARAHRHRPWQLLDVTVPGGSDLLTAGRVRSVYPGQSLLLAGRGRVDGAVQLRLRRGDDDRTLKLGIDRTIASDLAPRLYGQIAVGQLEDLGGGVDEIATAFARHFRITGQTCSLLMLESEADYQRFQIRPENDAFVVKSSPAAELVVRKLDEFAQQLQDPKARLLGWLKRLENAPGATFQLSTALKLAIDRMPSKAFDVTVPRLECRSRMRAATQSVEERRSHAERGNEEYEAVVAEAERRQRDLGAADALTALSSLIEQSPGDVVLTRDVAFTAMQWGLGGQAYSLLRRVSELRPFEPQTYLALAQCLGDLGQTDLALVYYEIAVGGGWNARYQDFQQIAGLEFSRLLRRIETRELTTSVPDYAAARRASLAATVDAVPRDLVVTLLWNTDRTDVDLHVLEPTGEECFYGRRTTRIGGRLTSDIREGNGAEMYTLRTAEPGVYKISAKYFGTDANRTSARTRVYVTVYESFGTPEERATRHAVTLPARGSLREVTSVKIAAPMPPK